MAKNIPLVYSGLSYIIPPVYSHYSVYSMRV